MRRILFVFGQVRIGDTFHLVPFFNALKRDSEITWVHSSYEREPVQLLKEFSDLSIKETIEIKTSEIPSDLRSISRFNQMVSTKYNLAEFGNFDDVIIERKVLSVHKPVPWIEPTDWNLRLHLEPVKGEYLVVHASTISRWKQIPALFFFTHDLPIVWVGWPGEPIGFCRDCDIDLRGKPLVEVARYVLGAKCVVGVHSSINVLAFYLSKPQVVCHFRPDLFKFSSYKETSVDLLTPDLTEVEEAVEGLLCQTLSR